MANEEKIVADVRESFGKGAARKLRVIGKIPAVLYGHGTDTQHISLPGHETMLLVRKANAVIDLNIAGKSQLALVKDVQKDPVRQIIEHIDLVIVRKGEKVQVDIPLYVEGETAPETAATLDATTISLEVEATNIPENIAVNVEGLEDGAQILAKDVILPSGATLVSDPDVLVVAVAIPVVLEVPEPEEVTEGEEGVEGEEAEAGEGEAAEGDGSAESSEATDEASSE